MTRHSRASHGLSHTQKQHFARARAQLQTGGQKTIPFFDLAHVIPGPTKWPVDGQSLPDPGNLGLEYKQKQRPKGRAEIEAKRGTPRSQRRRVSEAQRLQINSDVLSIDRPTKQLAIPDLPRRTVQGKKEKQDDDLYAPPSPGALPLGINRNAPVELSLEARRRKLLEKVDWVGTRILRPASIRFPTLEETESFGKRRKISKHERPTALERRTRCDTPLNKSRSPRAWRNAQETTPAGSLMIKIGQRVAYGQQTRESQRTPSQSRVSRPPDPTQYSDSLLFDIPEGVSHGSSPLIKRVDYLDSPMFEQYPLPEPLVSSEAVMPLDQILHLSSFDEVMELNQENLATIDSKDKKPHLQREEACDVSEVGQEERQEDSQHKIDKHRPYTHDRELFNPIVHRHNTPPFPEQGIVTHKPPLRNREIQLIFNSDPLSAFGADTKREENIPEASQLGRSVIANAGDLEEEGKEIDPLDSIWNAWVNPSLKTANETNAADPNGERCVRPSQQQENPRVAEGIPLCEPLISKLALQNHARPETTVDKQELAWQRFVFGSSPFDAEDPTPSATNYLVKPQAGRPRSSSLSVQPTVYPPIRPNSPYSPTVGGKLSSFSDKELLASAFSTMAHVSSSEPESVQLVPVPPSSSSPAFERSQTLHAGRGRKKLLFSPPKRYRGDGKAVESVMDDIEDVDSA